MPTHWGCLPGWLLGAWRAGGWEEGRGPRPGERRCPVPGEWRGGGEAAEPGQGWRGDPGSPVLISTRVLRGRGGRPRERQPQTHGLQRGSPAPSLAQRRQFLLPASAALSIQPDSAAPGAGVGRSGQRRGCIFGCPPSTSAGGSGGGVDRIGSEPNGTEDAARRGPGCAVQQLNPRRRPCATPPAPPTPILAPAPPSTPALPRSPLSQGWA